VFYSVVNLYCTVVTVCFNWCAADTAVKDWTSEWSIECEWATHPSVCPQCPSLGTTRVFGHITVNWLWCNSVTCPCCHRCLHHHQGLVITRVSSYGRPPASWPTAIIFYCWCFYPLTLFFFRRLISEVSGPIVTKLCHMFGSDCNFLNWVRNLGGPSPKKFGDPKNIKISDFALWSLISPDGNKMSSIGKRR